MVKKKYYVIWEGRTVGVLDNWDACKKSINGYPNARYKSFPTLAEAEKAFKDGYSASIQPKPSKKLFANKSNPATKPIFPSIAVDAAWNTVTGDMEYRGVYAHTAQELFRLGPYRDGTNNVGEFLAIVHALALLKKKGSDLPIYTDSNTAITWVRNKKTKTTLQPTPHNQILFQLLERAEYWLQQNSWNNRIIKWETKIWGEIPADFGRK